MNSKSDFKGNRAQYTIRQVALLNWGNPHDSISGRPTIRIPNPIAECRAKREVEVGISGTIGMDEGLVGITIHVNRALRYIL